MKTFNTRWTDMRSATMTFSIIAGLAMFTVGCGSSSDSPGGTGGAGGTGGSGAGTGGATVHLINYTFDSSAQMFALNNFPDTTSMNLAASNADAGANAPTAVFDSTVGGGSLKVTVTFTAYGQYVDPVVNVMPVVNLTGKTLHAKLQITSVSAGSFMGGAQLHVSTGANYSGYASGAFVIPATTGVFGDASLPLTGAVAPVDPTMVIQIGVQIFTGTLMPAGTPLPAPQDIVFNIDTITD
jgi:hypothetical protein